MPNLEKSANRSNLDGQSVRSTMRSHLIPYKRIYYYLYIIGIYGNEDPNNEIAWINTSNNITLPKRNTVWDVRVYNQTLIKVFYQPPKGKPPPQHSSCQGYSFHLTVEEPSYYYPRQGQRLSLLLSLSTRRSP